MHLEEDKTMKSTRSSLIEVTNNASKPERSHKRSISFPSSTTLTLPPKAPSKINKKLDRTKSFPLNNARKSKSSRKKIPRSDHRHRRHSSAPIPSQIEKDEPKTDSHKRYPSLPNATLDFNTEKSRGKDPSFFNSPLTSASCFYSHKLSETSENDVEELMSELTERKKIGDETDLRVPSIYNRLGNIHFRSGNYNEAAKSYVAALFAYEVALGTDFHSCIATTLGNLGTLRWKMGMLKQAMVYLQKSLEMEVEIHGSDMNLQVANALHSVGIVKLLNSDYDGALDMLSRALYARHEILGKEHVDVSRTIDAMGHAYMFQGNLDLAMKKFKKALKIKKMIFGKYHSSTVTTMINIAKVHRRLGNLNQAIDAYVDAVEVQKEMKNSFMDPTTMIELGITLHVLGDIYRLKGDYMKSLDVFSEALTVYRQSGAQDSDDRVLSLNKSMSLAEDVILGDYHL